MTSFDSTVKMKDTIEKKKYQKNTINRKGTDYELILAILFLKRAVESGKEFLLATERSQDGKFDDLYFELSNGEKVFLMQAKHKSSNTGVPGQIGFEDLTSQSDTNFSLLKYFNSYLGLKKEPSLESCWENVNLLLCTTIYPDPNLKGIQFSAVQEEDGIFWKGKKKLGCVYRVSADTEVIENTFSGAGSLLKKLAKKLSECVLEGKNINIEQLTIVKQYHLTLTKEVIQVNKVSMFADNFLLHPGKLSEETRKFRDLFFQCSIEYLKKKHPLKGDMPEAECVHSLGDEETDIHLSDTSVSSDKRNKKPLDYYGNIYKKICESCFEKIFWKKLVGQKLITPGLFGQVDQKTLKDLIKQIKESKSEGNIYEINLPEKDVHKLFGYVLIAVEELVKFNPDFLQTDLLTGNNKAIRDELLSFSDIYECSLNIKGINIANVFREKVFWKLEDDFTPEEEDGVKDEVRQFLKKMTFAITSPGEELREHITKELIGEFGERDGRSIFSTLLSDMTKWLGFRDKDGYGRYLTKTENPYVMAKNKYQRYNRFYVQEPVRCFTGRKKQLTEIHEVLRGKEGHTGAVLYLCGMGGVGKTQLAKKYSKESKQNYDGNVLWVECEDPYSISNSFNKYAKEMHINLTNDDGTDRELTFVAKDVYGQFSENISLFIFDNVGVFKDIESILPGDGLTGNKPFILITTRNRNLFKDQGPMNLERMDLDVLPEEEAMEFVMMELHPQNPSKEEVKALMNALGRLPLALQHAIAYIRSSFSNEYSVSDYVKLLEESPEEFNSLLEQDPSIGCDSYKMTIYKTFTISAEKIRKNNSENDKLALEILNYMAYLSPENVPSKLFVPLALKRIADKQRKETSPNGMISRAVNILKDMSIVYEEKELLQIHRVVQYVIRLKIAKENDDAERDTLRDILHLMSEDGALKNDLSHVRSVWYYASKYVVLIDSFYFRTDTKLSVYGKYCSTALHLLSESGKALEVDSILKHIQKNRRGYFNSVLEAGDLFERTPLYIAAENDRLNVVQTLIEHGAKVESKSKVAYSFNTTRRGYGWTPLFVAAYKGHENIVGYLVSVKKESRDVRDNLGRTPSVIAAHLGHVHLIRLPGFIGRNEDYNSLMLHAILCSTKKNSSLQNLKQFLDGIDENDLKGLLNSKLAEWTPLHHVIRSSSVDHVKLLLDRGAQLSRSGFTHLHMAATIGNLDIVKMLVNEGADPKDVNEDGWTSLHAAAQNDNTEVLEYFLDELKGNKRIDVNIRDGKDDTPLITAAYHGKFGVTKSLLERGASVNSFNSWGTTPIFQAVLGGNRRIVNRLLSIEDLVLDVTEIDRDRDTLFGMLHMTVLHLAAALDDIETVKLLVERRRMDVDVGKGESCTPLHIAALFNSSRVIEYLLSRRADIDATTAVTHFSKIIECLEGFGLVKSAPGIMSILAFKLLKIFKLFGRYADVILSYVTKMTPKSITKLCGYENRLLRMGSEVQGILAGTIFSIIFVRGKVGVLKTLLENHRNRYVDEMNEDESYFLERFSVGWNNKN